MAATQYQCPECSHIHDDPADAAYRLLVTCTSCALERELAAFERARQSDLVRAA
jgi:predicted RNA-binding Zn-ribbon protein involved in translation (DUF1610 family)